MKIADGAMMGMRVQGVRYMRHKPCLSTQLVAFYLVGETGVSSIMIVSWDHRHLKYRHREGDGRRYPFGDIRFTNQWPSTESGVNNDATYATADVAALVEDLTIYCWRFTPLKYVIDKQ